MTRKIVDNELIYLVKCFRNSGFSSYTFSPEWLGGRLIIIPFDVFNLEANFVAHMNDSSSSSFSKSIFFSAPLKIRGKIDQIEILPRLRRILTSFPQVSVLQKRTDFVLFTKMNQFNAKTAEGKWKRDPKKDCLHICCSL